MSSTRFNVARWPGKASAGEMRLIHDLWAQVHYSTQHGHERTCKLFEPATLNATPPFAVRCFELSGTTYELASWLPGPHPRDAVWWEELSVWVAMRKVA